MIYARQIDPRIQSPNIDFAFEEAYKCAVYGNKDFNQWICDEFRFLIDIIDDVDYDWLIGSHEEDISYLVDSLSFLRIKYTNEELIEFKRNLIEYHTKGFNPTVICKLISIFTHGNWSYKEITGCVQNDWNYFFYDTEYWEEESIRNFEIEYFNTGTEFDVDECNSFSCPTPFYSHEVDEDSIKKEISDKFDCDEKDIVLYMFDGYDMTPRYREA